MPLDLSNCRFQGPALPEPFVKFDLDKELIRLRLLPKATALKAEWEVYRRRLRELATSGGALRVRNHVVEPLVSFLGYSRLDDGGEVTTREGNEDAGALLVAEDGSKLRVWITSFDEDLYSPTRRGRAFRFSHLRRAQRVLLASGERAGLLTNGVELMLLISDPARPESTVTFSIDLEWKRSREVPDTFRLLVALARPEGVAKLAEIVDKARLQQAKVTKELRKQARAAIEKFIQGVLDHPANAEWRAQQTDNAALAKDLWHEGLILVYRLLFILKLESTDDPARSFSFASTPLWRNSFSPAVSLARYVREILDQGSHSGTLLESGLRTLFRLFEEGIESTELVVKPLGGALFGKSVMPILSDRVWGERAVAELLDQLLWTTPSRRAASRERVHYGPLDVEDLGRVYEALLELEPGIAAEPMSRLQRQKLQVVVPAAQGEQYRRAESAPTEPIEDETDDAEEEEESSSRRGSKVQWVEAIAPGTFYLRVGLGRKATGSYYTPHSFVRFLVQETLGPQLAERSPSSDPNPLAILKLKVLDPAMGSGHFLVEACRFLGEKLYEACRLCDEKALQAEAKAEKANGDERDALLETAVAWRQRIIDLPDPDDVLLNYLPSRSPEGEESGLSQRIALALCRRLIATHCLYGVDKNPLAVELAKLALWLESHAEGMPLTFVDHRLVVGDSITGPFWDKLLFRPAKPDEPIADLFDQDLNVKLTAALADALRLVRQLEATVGATATEIEAKQRTKVELDQALFPLRVAAAAWSGGVMLGDDSDDVGYCELLKTIVATGNVPPSIGSERVRRMVATGLGLPLTPHGAAELQHIWESAACVPALSYDLTFPEVFYPDGLPQETHGFDAVVGNPPWQGLDTSNREFYASFSVAVLEAITDDELTHAISTLLTQPPIRDARSRYEEHVEVTKRSARALFRYFNQNAEGASGATPDAYQLFCERGINLLSSSGFIGVVLPSAFHANDGAAGIRRQFLDDTRLVGCFSYENRQKLFEIDSRQKFAVVVARHDGPTEAFPCAFYLRDAEWLFAADRSPSLMTYSRDFLRKTTGASQNFLELRRDTDRSIAEKAYRTSSKSFGELRDELGLSMTEELHFSKNRWRLQATPRTPTLDVASVREALLAQQLLPFLEGKNIWQYTDAFEPTPAFSVPLSRLRGKERRVLAASYYRLAFRTIASATNERSGIFAVLSPGVICSNSVMPEVTPESRPNAACLLLLALANSFCFDWLLRLVVGSNITFNFLDKVPVPGITTTKILVHNGLRLSANHSLFHGLWAEQLGTAWRESGPAFVWPALPTPHERWIARSAVEAALAHQYGLSREQFADVLMAFKSSDYDHAAALCLEAFDEYAVVGPEAFVRRRDPYCDVDIPSTVPLRQVQLVVASDVEERQISIR